MIWGGAFPGVELALDSLDPTWVSTGRISLAAMLLVLVTMLTGTSLPLSHFLVPGERLTLKRTIGFTTGFAGVVLLVGGEQLLSGSAAGNDAHMLTAQLACVMASCCYAIGSIITRLCPPVNTTSFAAARLLSAKLIILPVVLLTSSVLERISSTSLSGVIFVAVFLTALATILLTILIRRAGPPFLSLVNYQVPIWAVLIGAVILSETIPSHFITSLLVILGGLAMAQHRLKQAA